MIWGPSPKEAAFAYCACASAKKFLDEYLTTGRPSAEAVKELVRAIDELENNTTGTDDLDERADDFFETAWEKAYWDPEARRLRRDTPDDESAEIESQPDAAVDGG